MVLTRRCTISGEQMKGREEKHVGGPSIVMDISHSDGLSEKLSKYRKWMLSLILIHLIVPSPHPSMFYPYWYFTWFGFHWAPDGGWIPFIQYAFVGWPAFVIIGLATILPFTLLILLLLGSNVRSPWYGFICLVLSIGLVGVYFYGWFDYTWPTPYQPVQSITAVLVTLLAYKRWSSLRGPSKHATTRADL